MSYLKNFFKLYVHCSHGTVLDKTNNPTYSCFNNTVDFYKLHPMVPLNPLESNANVLQAVPIGS